MADASSVWTHTDPDIDFHSTLWVYLGRQVESIYVAPAVTIAQDLTDPQQMNCARADLEEVMAKTEDHLGLLLSLLLNKFKFTNQSLTHG